MQTNTIDVADGRIRNKTDYDAAVAEVERLFGATAGTVASERFARLAALIEAYEQENYPVAAPSLAAQQQYEAEKQGFVLTG